MSWGGRGRNWWFERVDRGVYALKPKGRADLAQFPELVARFRGEPDG